MAWNGKKLSKKEQEEAKELFQKYQQEMLGKDPKTRAEMYWSKLYPILKPAINAAILTMNKHHYVRDLEDKVEDSLVELCGRYMRNPDYIWRESPATLARFMALGRCRNTNVIGREKDTLSLEWLAEEKNVLETWLQGDLSEKEKEEIENEWLQNMSMDTD